MALMNAIEVVTGAARACRLEGLRDWASDIEAGQVFEIDADIMQSSWDARKLFQDGDGKFEAPKGLRLPAPITILHFSNYMPDGAFIVSNQTQLGNNCFDVSRVSNRRMPTILGYFDTSDGQFAIHKSQPESTSDCIGLIIMTLSLITQPRFVKREPGGTRADRRRAQRGGGFAVDAWHRCSWNIGKEVAAKISADTNFHKVALHYRRGHYRRAEGHYKGARQLPDALNPEHRTGWWQWIEGDWVGHPLFGIKRSVHAPHLSPDVIARKWGTAA